MKWTEERITRLGEINKEKKIQRYFSFKKFVEAIVEEEKKEMQENVDLYFSFLVKLEKEEKIIFTTEGKNEIDKFYVSNTSNN